MIDLILNELKTKFDGVSEIILSRIAAKIAKTATTEEQVKAAVDAYTLQQLIESYGDSRANEAQQTAVRNYETKYGLKNGLMIGEGDKNRAPDTNNADSQKTGGGTDTVPSWAQALIDSNNALTDRMNKMDSEHRTTARKQQLSSVISKLPENLRKGYARTSVEDLSDDEFNALMEEIGVEVDGIMKETKQRGAVFGSPTVGASGNQNGELSKEQQESIAHRDGKVADGQPF